MTAPLGMIKDVLTAVKNSLAAAGWSKRKTGFSIDLPNELYGFLGLNKAVGQAGDKYLEINPVVGVEVSASRNS